MEMKKVKLTKRGAAVASQKDGTRKAFIQKPVYVYYKKKVTGKKTNESVKVLVDISRIFPNLVYDNKTA